MYLRDEISNLASVTLCNTLVLIDLRKTKHPTLQRKAGLMEQEELNKN